MKTTYNSSERKINMNAVHKKHPANKCFTIRYLVPLVFLFLSDVPFSEIIEAALTQ